MLPPPSAIFCPLPAESDYSEQSDEDGDPEERRRSLRPRRARREAEGYLLELPNTAGAAGAGPAAAGGAVAAAGVALGAFQEEEALDAGAYDSEGGEQLAATESNCSGVG